MNAIRPLAVAAREFSIPRNTLISWVKRYDGIGHRVAGRYVVDTSALKRLLSGESFPRCDRAREVQ